MIDLFTFFVYGFLLLTIVVFTKNAIPKNYSLKEDFDKPFSTRLNSGHYIILLLISFIIGFRYDVGVDWSAYKESFEILKVNPSISFTDQVNEWGFFMINKWVSGLGGNYTLMFFIVAFISWYFIFKGVPTVLLPLTLFFLFADGYFFWSMNGIRQFVAVGIYLYAIRFIIHRNFKIYFLLIFCGALFHYSILLLIPLCFIPFDRLYKIRFWFMAIIFSFFVGQTPFLSSALQILFQYVIDFVPVFSKYSWYFDSGYYAPKEQIVGLGYMLNLLSTLFILFFSQRIVKEYPQTKIYFVLIFLGAVIFNFFYMYSSVGRINIYFMILRPIALSLIVIQLYKNRIYQIFSFYVVYVYFLLFIANIYNSSNLCSPFRFSFMK